MYMTPYEVVSYILRNKTRWASSTREPFFCFGLILFNADAVPHAVSQWSWLFPRLLPTDKRRLARCSDSFVGDIAHRRTRKRSFGYFQLNTSVSPSHPQKPHGLTLLFTVLNKGIQCTTVWRGTVNSQPEKKKKHVIFPLLMTLDIWDTVKIQTISMETFVQISHYIQGAGVTYSLVMFSLIMMKWYDKVNESNHWF